MIDAPLHATLAGHKHVLGILTKRFPWYGYRLIDARTIGHCEYCGGHFGSTPLNVYHVRYRKTGAVMEDLKDAREILFCADVTACQNHKTSQEDACKSTPTT